MFRGSNLPNNRKSSARKYFVLILLVLMIRTDDGAKINVV